MAFYQIRCITKSDASNRHKRITKLANSSVPWHTATDDPIRLTDKNIDISYVIDVNRQRANSRAFKSAGSRSISAWTDNLLAYT